MYAKSPFQADKRLVLAASDVSSRYSRRGRTQYERIADYIEGVIGGKTGNYMIFFPSYQFLFQVQKVLEERQEQGKLKFEWKAQSSNMSEEEREEFLLSFKEEPKESFAGLCVMGGSFFRRDRSERRETDRSDHHRNRTSTGKSGTGDLKGIF